MADHERGRGDPLGSGRGRRHRLRAHRRRRAGGRPVRRGHPRGGAEVLHRPLRRAGLRGRAARAAGQAGALSPDEAGRVGQDRPWPGRRAHAVGDLDGLVARLDALRRSSAPSARSARPSGPRRSPSPSSARRRSSPRPRSSPTANDWRNGANRLRDLLEEWKALPRLDRASDDALWRRFSDRPHRLHPPPQGALRRAAREARGRPGRQGAPGQGGRGARPTRPTGARPPAATAT